ncbi:MAG: serine hydrolase domain-containing protein [Betaproteobacteria bacterium]
MDFDVSLLLDRFDSTIVGLRERYPHTGPGFCAGLAVEGQVVRAEHHGLGHLEWQQALAGNTRFYLASETKFWVAALVMQAVAAGRITLDADMRDRLPALAGAQCPVRLGHLLRHTSGVDDYLYLWRVQLGRSEDDLVTRAQAFELIRLAGDVDFEPGSRHEYSNSNYLLLADWLERDAGLPLNELARRRFFEPWKMHDTSFEQDPRRALPRRARSYRSCADGGWHDLPVNLATWGDGGMWSTLDDLLRAEARLQEDYRQRGSQSLLGLCAEEDGRFGPADLPYRFGIELMRVANRRMLFHGGGFAGFSSLVQRCPNDESVLVLLANVEGFEASATWWSERLWSTAQPKEGHGGNGAQTVCKDGNVLPHASERR